MESFLTYFYEYHFLYITGIEHVESKSIQGASIMKLQFHPQTDMSSALAEVIAYVNRATAFMPPGTPAPFVTRFDAGSVPVGYLVFSTNNPNRTLGQMQDEALNRIRPMFATLPGVSAPPPFGGSARTIVMNVNPDQLRARGISPDEVVRAMANSNQLSPSGNMTIDGQFAMVPTNTVPKNIKDLEGTVIRTGPEGTVFARDVGAVTDSSDFVTSYALVNGKRNVYLPVTKRADASTLTVVNTVKANLPRFQSFLPEDITVSYEFDQSPVVTHSINELVKEGGLGAILTGLMVLLFLRDWRSAMIVVINIPLALMAAIFGLWITGQSINLMTLGGLALAVGILVDEATVAVENIHTHLSNGKPLARASMDALRETAVPRLLAVLSILAVFVPAFFMTGVAKALFTPLALAVGFSMIASFILSSTLVPILSVWFLRGHAATSEAAQPGFIKRSYQGLASFFVTLRWVLIPVYLIVCVAIIGSLGRHMGGDIFPQTDSAQFALRVRAPSGASVERTEAITLQVLNIINREAKPENVALTMGLVGVHAPNYPVNLIHLWNSGPDEAWLAVQLKENSGINLSSLKENLRAAFAKELPGIGCSFEPSDLVGRVMSFGAGAPIEIAVGSADMLANHAHAQKILELVRVIPGIRDARINQNVAYPAVNVNVDRERAGMLGISAAGVNNAVVTATSSSRFTTANFWADPAKGQSINFQVQIPSDRTQSIADLEAVPVGQSADGTAILLRNVATVTKGTTIGQYERYNMVRQITVTANLHNTDLASMLPKIKAAIADAGSPPPKGQVDVRGQAGPLNELFTGFTNGLAIAVVALFLMLAAYFQSFRLALTVMFIIPAVLVGILVMLTLTHISLNIQSGIGSIMAVGVGVANAILLIVFAEKTRLANADAKLSAVSGASSRLRPIVMTSLAMIAGMLPMALGIGGSSQQIAPLALAVIGGLIAATIANLLILPAVFTLLAGRTTTSASIDPDDRASPLFIPSTPSSSQS
jgi:multidrug efflux pump subunit AcrB